MVFTSISLLTQPAPSANFLSIEAVLKVARGPPSMMIIFFIVVVLFSFAKCHMHHVAKSLAYLFADVLPQADDEARRSHLDNLAVVWHAVEGGMNRQASFPEERLDVE